MKLRTGKFTEEQIIGFVRQAEAWMPIMKSARKHGLSDASLPNTVGLPTELSRIALNYAERIFGENPSCQDLHRIVK